MLDVSRVPFWADRGTDRARETWAAERYAFERLSRVSETLRDIDPESQKAAPLLRERRELEVQLGLTCTQLLLSSAGRARSVDCVGSGQSSGATVKG